MGSNPTLIIDIWGPALVLRGDFASRAVCGVNFFFDGREGGAVEEASSRTVICETFSSLL